jgi:hypothetical protein
MRLRIVLRLSHLLSLLSVALMVIPQLSSATEAVGFLSCPSCRRNYLQETAYAAQSRRTSFVLPSSKPMQAACNRVMSSDGRVWAMGRMLQRLMYSNSAYRAAFMNDRALGAVCPRFRVQDPNRTDQDRLDAWTWLFAVLANQESSCDPHAVGDASMNLTTPYGMWQLPIRQGNRIGQECMGDITDINVQERCAVFLTYFQISQYGSAVGSNTHWGPLRSTVDPHWRYVRVGNGWQKQFYYDHRYHAEISPNMTKFRGCQ